MKFEGVRIREQFLTTLTEVKHVDVNREIPRDSSQNDRFLVSQNGLQTFQDSTVQLLRPYRFVIAVENSAFEDYVTERIINAYLAGAIPIYWGTPNLDRYFNPSTYIDIRNYASLSDVADLVLEAEGNESLYQSFFSEPPISFEQWRSLFWWFHDMPSEELTRAIMSLKKLGEDPRKIQGDHVQADQQKLLLYPPIPQVNISSPVNGKRAIFCATSGHTGTHLLTDMLRTFSDTYAEHEPYPRMLLDEFMGALPETRTVREKQKLGHILEVMRDSSDKTVYAEMSNMFIKTFWDLDWYSHFDEVHVIILRRWGPSVVRAHVNRGLGDDNFRTRSSWSQYVETMGLADAAISWPPKAENNSMTRMVYYVLDTEARLHRLREKLSGKVTFVELSYEKLVEADPVYIERVFTKLGYPVTEKQLGVMMSKIGPKPAAKLRIAAPVSERECLNAMCEYLALYEPKIDQRGLQALMKHPTTSTDFKIIAVAQVWQASEYISEWLRLVLQFSDSVVLVDDKSDDNTVSIAETYSSSVTVLQKLEWSFEEESAQLLGLHEALRQGATHIVCLDTDEILTANLARIARAIIISLPENTNVRLHMWHPWDGIVEVVESAMAWGTVQRTSGAYRFERKNRDEVAWGAHGRHHIGRLPAGVSEFIDLDKSCGGILHFKYANLEAYRVKILWYKLMEWREIKTEYKNVGPSRLRSMKALHNFYESKYPRSNFSRVRIPQEWIGDSKLEPFQTQGVTQEARKRHIAMWLQELSSQNLDALIGTDGVLELLSGNQSSYFDQVQLGDEPSCGRILYQKEAALQEHYDAHPIYFFQGDLIKFYDAMWTSFPLPRPPQTWGVVLDLGCGDGRLGEYLSKKFPERYLVMHGVDYSQERLRIARKRASNWHNITATFSCSDAHYILPKLAQAGQKFDVVTAFEVLEHLVDPRTIVDMCRGLLKDDGVMIASIPKDMPNIAHLSVYHSENDVHERLAPDFIGEDKSRAVHNADRKGFALMWRASPPESSKDAGRANIFDSSSKYRLPSPLNSSMLAETGKCSMVIVNSQGGVGSSSFMKLLMRLSYIHLNDLNDVEGLKHGPATWFAHKNGRMFFKNRTEGFICVRKALVILGDPLHSIESVYRRFNTNHLNKWRKGAGKEPWPKGKPLAEIWSEIKTIGHDTTGLSHYVNSWLEAGSSGDWPILILDTEKMFAHAMHLARYLGVREKDLTAFQKLQYAPKPYKSTAPVEVRSLFEGLNRRIMEGTNAFEMQIR